MTAITMFMVTVGCGAMRAHRHAEFGRNRYFETDTGDQPGGANAIFPPDADETAQLHVGAGSIREGPETRDLYLNQNGLQGTIDEDVTHSCEGVDRMTVSP